MAEAANEAVDPDLASVEHHGEDGKDQSDHGGQEVGHAQLAVLGEVGLGGRGDQVVGVAVGLAGLDSQLLGLVHGADIQTEQDDQQDGDDGEHTVQIELEHAEIQVIGTHAGEVQGGDLGGQQTHQVHAVITDGGHRDQRCAHGIGDVGQLYAGDMGLVGDGTHDDAHQQAALIEDEYEGGDPCQQLALFAVVSHLLGPATEGLRATAGAEHIHEATNERHDDQHARVPAVGNRGNQVPSEAADQAVDGVKVMDDGGTYPDADEHGDDGLLGNEGQDDGDQRGDQAPCAVLRCRFAVTGSIADNGQSEHENGHQTYTDKISFLFHDSLLSCIVLF